MSASAPQPPARIVVGIGDRAWRSVDAGRSWSEAPRSGVAAAGPAGVACNEVRIGRDGLGLARAREAVRGDPDRTENALLFLTRDGGETWSRSEPRLSLLGRLRAGSGWPPEAIDSLAVQPGGLLAFAWEDPWLHEGPHAHLVASSDAGASWRYARLADGCYRLARASDGILRVFGPGVVSLSANAGRTIQKHPVTISWPELPPRPDRLMAILRDVHFATPSDASGLVVCRDADLDTPLVGLACSADAARTWRVVHAWPTAPDRDYNAEGVVSLAIEPAWSQTRSGLQ